MKFFVPFNNNKYPEDLKALVTEEYWKAMEKKRPYYFIADQKLKEEKTFFKGLHKWH